MAQGDTDETVRTAQRSMTNPAVIASAVSVGLSWYFFYMKGDTERGTFVGLWPPTILAFASYFEQARAREKIDRLTSAGGIRESVQRMVQGEQ